MSILCDVEIASLANIDDMIDPFFGYDHFRPKRTISYGLTSFGYDARLDDIFKIFSSVNQVVIDPKAFDQIALVDHQDSTCIIPPNSFVLGRTMEYFRIPRDVLAVCLGKSTYARCGLVVNVTPLEPGWEGHVILELSNTTPLPIKVYAGEGICQFVFFKGDRIPQMTYTDRSGKYQHQRDITLPRVT